MFPKCCEKYTFYSITVNNLTFVHISLQRKSSKNMIKSSITYILLIHCNLQHSPIIIALGFIFLIN